MEKFKSKNNKKLTWEIVTGVSAGICNGLFGGGGGMIVVPMMMFLLKKTSKISHATAILIILPMSIVSGLIYSSYFNLRVSIILPIVIGVTAGGVLGALLLKKLSSKWIVIIFSIIMAVAGGKMLIF